MVFMIDALIFDLVHGYLIVSVRVDFPTGVGHRTNYLRMGLASTAVDRDRWYDLHWIEHALEAPETHAHPYRASSVRMVGQHGLTLRRRDHRARHGPREERPSENTGQIINRSPSGSLSGGLPSIGVKGSRSLGCMARSS
jgi:hypothetical protein